MCKCVLWFVICSTRGPCRSNLCNFDIFVSILHKKCAYVQMWFVCLCFISIPRTQNHKLFILHISVPKTNNHISQIIPPPLPIAIYFFPCCLFKQPPLYMSRRACSSKSVYQSKPIMSPNYHSEPRIQFCTYFLSFLPISTRFVMKTRC